ncbi:MAG TPA: hypothetical protein VFE42_10205, partial [Chloroflexota bacterium]|nr:hypothetical protein [Chloroflexota bacterium]
MTLRVRASWSTLALAFSLCLVLLPPSVVQTATAASPLFQSQSPRHPIAAAAHTHPRPHMLRRDQDTPAAETSPATGSLTIGALTTAIAISIATPSTGTAQAAPALPALRTPRPALLSATLTVPAATYWTNTGLSVQAGDLISITAAGSWTPAVNALPYVGPDGEDPTLQPSGDVFTNLQDIGHSTTTVLLPHYAALVGYIGATPPAPGSYANPSILPQAQRV